MLVLAVLIPALLTAGLLLLNAYSQQRASIARQMSSTARALVLATGPDAAHGEITDKGYIAQALARRLRAAERERLFANPAPADVMEF